MKSAVEPLSPTRVRLTVEVPFEELAPNLSAAYRQLGRQVRVRGFRPGKVPPAILDRQVGRGVVLEQAVQEAVPKFYGEALRANEVQVLGHPEVEVTSFEDGSQLVFTAEVDVRPEFALPEYDGLSVTVDDVGDTDLAVDEQVAALRDRFAVLRTADRPVQSGDFVLLDIAATVDGAPVPGSSATGLSYQVGDETLMPGLDEALIGRSEGETTSFTSELMRGEYAGRSAEVSVTVRSVKIKELPQLDDEFAQTASEFDTMAELRADVHGRLAKVGRLEQALQARDRVLDALLDRVEVPLPDSVVEEEVTYRRESLDRQLAEAALTRADYLAQEGRTEEEIDAEITGAARKAITAQFLLEAIAGKEQVEVTNAELTDQVVRRARQVGLAPDVYAKSVVDAGQLPQLAAEIVRGKALALTLERAQVTDASGRPVDIQAIGAEFTTGPAEGTGAGTPVDDPADLGELADPAS